MDRYITYFQDLIENDWEAPIEHIECDDAWDAFVAVFGVWYEDKEFEDECDIWGVDEDGCEVMQWVEHPIVAWCGMLGADRRRSLIESGSLDAAVYNW